MTPGGRELTSKGREYVLRKIFRRLLTYYYLYLNNFVVEPIITQKHSLVAQMVDDILLYHLKKKRTGKFMDEDGMTNILEHEEHSFIDKIRHTSRKFKNHMKRMNNDREKVVEFMKQNEGIPHEIVDHCDRLEFK